MNAQANPQVKIETSEGEILVELWPDVTPKHAENFLKLSSSGFYDNLIFHRVIKNFVIQGGCPDGTGMGGPGWRVPAEFNDRKHDKGVLSMARSNDPNSAGSQFFICLGREHCQHLDRQYTAFGTVLEGLDVVDRIGTTKVGAGDRPVKPIKIIKATVLEK